LVFPFFCFNVDDNNNMTAPTSKLIIIAILLACAVLLGSGVLTLQIFVNLERQKRRPVGSASPGIISSSNNNNNNIIASGGGTSSSTATGTLQPPLPASHSSYNLLKYAPDGSRHATSSKAYWNLARIFLKEWDALQDDTGEFDDDDDDLVPLLSRASFYNQTADGGSSVLLASPIESLQRAAKAGHATAQFYVATAHASGIWPVPLLAQESLSSSSSQTTRKLIVTDEFTDTHSSKAQLTMAYLYWHMAAVGGNLEAAMTLAFRMDEQQSSSSKSSAQCADSLPYYQAAANGIVDFLEASKHSRAKVIPPQDKHYLAQVHMHGGTSSQLDWNNKPHESNDALQFYHLKATASQSADVHAAYTLAHLYHYGLRGVPQNLTLALSYYEIAADEGRHWESAGHAGMFNVLGMGMESPNLIKARKYFKVGAPVGLEGCRRRFEQSILLQKAAAAAQEEEAADEEEVEDVDICDAQSVNGMGLLYLTGIPDVFGKDLVKAEKYFALAKEMGGADANYNLAMMWLGWKTHYKNIEDLTHGGMSASPESSSISVVGDGISGSSSNAYALHASQVPSKQDFKGPISKEYTDAIKLLTIAANKGHLQARHRLGMIYSQGIKMQGNAFAYDALKADCQKAKVHFQWIVENASPHRSKRLGMAYTQYTDGNLEESLRNYLMAAETGSPVAQANAAFLLERGVCLDLKPKDCAKASVRLWKAAAARGHAEASLRVGDFYYYGRMRSSRRRVVGPFGWVHYILYPEEYLPHCWNVFQEKARVWLQDDQQDDESEKVCANPADDPTTCHKEAEEDEKEEESPSDVESDLAMAAHYYQIAVEKHHSPRANFNLGFLHEWGLGLQQDFPLAKRHYDLAATGHPQEASIAVQIALMAMSVHEYIVKLEVAWKEWREKQVQQQAESGKTAHSEPVDSPRMASAGGQVPVGHPVPFPPVSKTQMDVILSHLFSWESLLIVFLTIILLLVMELRRTRQR
jgi:TPR repeat protein